MQDQMIHSLTLWDQILGGGIIGFSIILLGMISNVLIIVSIIRSFKIDGKVTSTSTVILFLLGLLGMGLGIFGFSTGIIGTLNVMAFNAHPKPTEMAGGTSMALITIVLGSMVFCQNVFFTVISTCIKKLRNSKTKN